MKKFKKWFDSLTANDIIKAFPFFIVIGFESVFLLGFIIALIIMKFQGLI